MFISGQVECRGALIYDWNFCLISITKSVNKLNIEDIARSGMENMGGGGDDPPEIQRGNIIAPSIRH